MANRFDDFDIDLRLAEPTHSVAPVRLLDPPTRGRTAHPYCVTQNADCLADPPTRLLF